MKYFNWTIVKHISYSLGKNKTKPKKKNESQDDECKNEKFLRVKKYYKIKRYVYVIDIFNKANGVWN